MWTWLVLLAKSVSSAAHSLCGGPIEQLQPGGTAIEGPGACAEVEKQNGKLWERMTKEKLGICSTCASPREKMVPCVLWRFFLPLSTHVLSRLDILSWNVVLSGYKKGHFEGRNGHDQW